MTITGTAGNDAALNGTTNDDLIQGLAGNDVLNGDLGNDTLDGGTGADTLNGDDGNDTYIVDNVGDVVNENSGEGTDLVRSSVSYTLGSEIENLTLTGSAAINATGNADDNILTGNSGANVINGGAGADTMAGLGGNDTYYVDDVGDVINENGNAGIDTVRTDLTYVLGANLDNLVLTGSGNVDGTGNTLKNYLTGNTGDNVLTSLDGNDTLDGGVGADTMVGGIGNDIYYVDDAGDVVTEAVGEGTDTVRSAISFTLGGNIEVLVLTGSGNVDGTGDANNNSITGNAGNNVLDGGNGNDTLIGGAGNDTYYIDNSSDRITEAAKAGTDLVYAGFSYTLGSNLENLTLTGAGNINGTGNTLANVITGNSGNNVISGGTGSDTMIGGDGNDTYVVDNILDHITENANEGTDQVNSSIAYTLDANVENLTLTGKSNINGIGNALDNVITGNAGSNVLDGGVGADTLIGGAGNDIYVVDDAGDVITDTAGTDLVRSSITYTLAAGLENLTLTGTGNIDATGNGSNNIILGNSGNNSIDGGAGNDKMSGGAGDDTYVVDAAGDSIVENASEGTDLVQSGVTWTLGLNIENLTLTGVGNINATGNTLANVLTGNSGNNIINGGAGVDTLVGGDGNDTYYVDQSGDVITENANEGTDLVYSTVSYTLGAELENLTLTGAGSVNGTGNAGDNLITGNSGANILDGGVGADTLVGGTGNDTYVVDDAGDVVTEGAAAGTDLVRSSITYTLGANLENLTLTGGGNIDGTGNTVANAITGNTGNNVLTGDDGNDTIDGGAGDDTLVGGDDNDTYIVDSTADVVTEAANEGTDLIKASVTYILGSNVENLTLTGTSNIDGTGNADDNIILGNSGNNSIDGGAGADTMYGGAGNDTYVVDDAGDVVAENFLSGTDEVQSGVTYTLGNNLENLTLTGVGNIDGTGNASNNVITGNTGNNALDGGDGNDTIDGGAGADTMTGGDGDDIYYVDDAGDSVSENSGEGTDLVNSSVTFALDADTENLTLTGSGNINGTGNDLDNIILGNSGNNSIDGGIGADTLTGGDGNDTYVVDDAGDVVTEAVNEGIDLVQSSITYALGANLENLTLTGTDDVDGTGNALDNVILGNSGANNIDGGVGADTMTGGDGDDHYTVDDAGDEVNENANEGADTVDSSVSFVLGEDIEDLNLTGVGNIDGTGNGLDNVITGNDGNNMLDGGDAGADTLIGGLGNDTYVVDDLGDTLVENSNEGTDQVNSSVTYTLLDDFENLTLTGTTDIDGTGNSADNVIIGNSGDNVIDGDAGADTMSGGAGDDLFIVDDAGDTVSENANEGMDTVQSAVSFTLGANIEKLVLTAGAGDIDGTGNALDNVITGNEGANSIDGGAGDDSMTGGDGDDTYVVDSVDDVVVENANEGADLVQSSVTFTLDDNIENLTLTGTGNINGIGNDLDNAIEGNTGNNVLNGGEGADTLTGGLGNDTYVVDDVGDVLTENANEGTDLVQSYISFTLDADFENLTLMGSDTIDGTGNDGDNLLTGNSGDNVLDGGIGADTMVGHDGNDTYIVDDVQDVVTESANEGTDEVQSSVTWTLGNHVENLTLTGTDDIDGTGNALGNILTGNAGANVLDGGTGIDAMTGGDGDDTYVVDNAGDVVTENANEGTDLVQSSVSWVLGGDIENLTLTGSGNITATGNDLDNEIIGNAGNNTIDGGVGADTMTGNDGNDIFTVDDVNDVVTENAGEGTDRINASVSYTMGDNVENMTLTGTADIDGTGNVSDNNITGNSGANILAGGDGQDTMTGGLGADTFVFTSDTAYNNVDTIVDFNTGQGDIIDVHEMLSAFDPLNESITDYVQITDNGSTSFIAIDQDGAGVGFGWVQIAQLNGVTGITDEVSLVNAGTLIVV